MVLPTNQLTNNVKARDPVGSKNTVTIDPPPVSVMQARGFAQIARIAHCHHQNVNVMKLVLKNHWLYQRECFTKYF